MRSQYIYILNKVSKFKLTLNFWVGVRRLLEVTYEGSVGTGDGKLEACWENSCLVAIFLLAANVASNFGWWAGSIFFEKDTIL